VQKVLVVDDEPNIRNILDFTLGAEGYLVIAAGDGEQGFEVALAELPDLILLDVMMPRSDGFEVCRRLKEDPRTAHIPVVMLTAKSGRDDRLQGEAARADGYITKPFSPQRVVETVQSLLGVPR
jgi:two-component system alkaline phosphatase synthesis response regulator PhoP